MRAVSPALRRSGLAVALASLGMLGGTEPTDPADRATRLARAALTPGPVGTVLAKRAAFADASQAAALPGHWAREASGALTAYGPDGGALLSSAVPPPAGSPRTDRTRTRIARTPPLRPSGALAASLIAGPAPNAFRSVVTVSPAILASAPLLSAPAPPAVPVTVPERPALLARVERPRAPALTSLAITDAADLAEAQRCLAEAVYFESRGESETGQRAVAQVVVNRVRSGRFARSVCGVIYQNRHRRNRCQFSYACDDHPEIVRDSRAWALASRIAEDALTGRVFLTDVGASTHYHATYVAPRWRHGLDRVGQIGTHVFYALPGLIVDGHPQD